MENKKLEEIVEKEMRLAETLLGLMRQQQNALVHFKDTELLQLAEQQQNILFPLENLEKERMKIIKQNMGLQNGEAASRHQEQFKKVARQIMTLNHQNQTLTESALNFVKKTVRVLTEDFTKKLVDMKV